VQEYCQDEWEVRSQLTMRIGRRTCLRTGVLALLASLTCLAQDPLPSWNESAAKKAILDFVARTTQLGSLDFVPAAERIATFDNDGTLWVEQPVYTQFAFALDRVKALAPKHPEWKNQQPFQSILAGDMKGFEATGDKGLMRFANMLTTESHRPGASIRRSTRRSRRVGLSWT
jgi:hypothetical protein